MCDEFENLVDNVDSLGEQLDFKLSEALRRALFISKGKPRLELRKFQQIDGSLSCQLKGENLVFNRSSVLRFCQFLRACKINGEVFQPTISGSPHVIRSPHAIKQQIIKIDINNAITQCKTNNNYNGNTLHNFDHSSRKSQISCLGNNIYIISPNMIESFDGLTIWQVGQSVMPLKHFLPMGKGHFISIALGIANSNFCRRF